MVKYEFDEDCLEELVDVVRTLGPVPLGDVAKTYKAVHGINFNLGKNKLRVMQEEGLFQGKLRINWKAQELQLQKRGRGSSKAPTTKLRPGTKAPSSAAPLVSSLDVPSVSYHLIDSVQSCMLALIAISPDDSDGDTVSLSLKRICEGRTLAVELEGSCLGSDKGSISLVKIAGSWGPTEAVIFDVAVLEMTTTGRTLLHEQLCPLLEDESSTKVVHDFTHSAIALRLHFGTALNICSLCDTQLAIEVLLGDIQADLNTTLAAFAGDPDPVSDGPHRPRASDSLTVDATRPINPRALSRATRSVTSLAKAAQTIMTSELDQDQKKQVLQASKLKIDNAMATLDGTCRMTFRDHGSCSGGGVGRLMISYELKEVEDKTVDGGSGKNMELPVFSGPRRASRRVGSFLGRTQPTKNASPAMKDANSPLDVLQLIPELFLEEHLSTRETNNLQDLQDVMLDEGRRPKALFQGRGNVFLCSDPNIVVTAHDIDRVVGQLEHDGRFGDDNRAGFPDELHRVSVLRRKHERKIIGVTLRIGRCFKGSAGLIDDLLFPVTNPSGESQRLPSILVLGVPGSGKTTAIRDICRKISFTQTVMIVDTSNEIAGDGDTPHREAIGESRRIMVPNKKDQHRVMTEALQNHTPHTIVVDEISDDKEACACLDIKERGVRVVASAHGDFRSLLKNPKLNTLVGGKTSVTVGDGLAKANGGNKVQTQRAGAPIFDTIIELKRGDVNEWSVIRDVGAAVDALLSGRSYEVERRTRLTQDSQSGHKDSNVEDVTFGLAYDKEAKRT